MKPFLFLFASIVFEVIGTSALKASEQFSKPLPATITVLAYLATFYFLSLTLRTMPIGIAYAIWSGCGIVLVSIAGYFLYGQKLDLPSIAGMLLIVSGVLVINLFSKALPH